MLYRRALLKSAALAATAPSLLSTSVVAQSVEPSPLVQKAIPSTGETVPVIGIGTNHYGHGIGEGNDAELMAPLRETMARYAELGGGLIDTSIQYRNSEYVLGTLFEELGLKNQFFISTKIKGATAEESVEQLAQASQKLGSRVLDLVSVHNLVEWQTNLPVLRDAKEAGVIRYYGVTTADIPQYDEVVSLMNSEPLDFVQVNYSLQERGAEDRILGLAQEKGIAVIINRAFNRGNLFASVQGHEVPDWAADFDASSWAQIFLKYVVSHPAVLCTIPGTTKIHHLVDNLGAAQGRLPTAEQRKQIEAHYASIVG